jgi:pyridoxal phosphate enzyme (YggS family)
MSAGIRQRLAEVGERMAQAAVRAGRRPEDITLIAVTKTFDSATVQEAVDAGVQNLGENRVQEAAAKMPAISGVNLRWHLIGHLQSNKARQAVASFDVIHSVDSAAMVHRLNRIAAELNRKPVVLVQVDLAGEETKSGASEAELGDIVSSLDQANSLEFAGLMTLPPLFEDPESVRPYFSRLRRLLDALNSQRAPESRLRELSMGMSHDFELAIEEGATMVRVGTAIFGARTSPAATGKR